jgi:TM2 domain-containing membrane protein YozV
MPNQQITKKRNWILVAIMSIFFGWLGADRLLLGQQNKAIMKFFTLGGLLIWGISDSIRILLASKTILNDGDEWVRTPQASIKVEDDKEIVVLDHVPTLIASGAGLDRFHMGKKHRVYAYIKAFTFGGFFIWWFVDYIRLFYKGTFNNTIAWKSTQQDKNKADTQ